MRRGPAPAPAWIWPLALLGLILLSLGLWRERDRRPSRSPSGEARDLVLILEDGLRADHGGALWQALGDPPALRFRAAVAQSPRAWTSIGSLLTGRYPSAIPLCAWPAELREQGPPWCAPIPEGVPDLPQILELYGYRELLLWDEAGMVERELLRARFPDHRSSRGEDPSALALEWWRESRRHPRLLVIIEDLSRDLRRSPLTEPAALSAAMQAEARRRGALLRPLVEEVLRQEQRPALLIFSSAHGLSLGEQSGADNMPTQAVQSEILLERTLHVPLYLAGDVQPGERSEVVELLDLLPTALAAAGAEPPAGISGRDLRGPLPADRHAYAEFGDMLALRGPRYLLSGRFWRHGGSALDPELSRRLEAGPGASQSSYHLHDILADPLQERDLAGGSPELLAQMWAELRRRRGAEAAPPRGGLSPEQVQGLRAVQSQGYW